MNIRLSVLGWAVGLAWTAARAQAPAAAPSASVALPAVAAGGSGVSESLRREAAAALDRGAQWLKARQQEDGHWSNAEHPALTAFSVWALALSGRAQDEAVKKGVACVRRFAQPNGGIFKPGKGGGLSNYNTAICMVALHLAGDPADAALVRKAREFVARSQHLGGDVYHGGMGYDAESGRPYADLSNSYLAYEAMRMTESVEDARKTGEARADLDWKAAQDFVQKTQNDSRFNTQAWATDDPSDRGGFAYHPEQTRAGTATNAAGAVKFRSMRGMTYAGLLSYIYADVERTDPRVEATLTWVVNHWKLDANNALNPGGEKTATNDEREGLFYLYNVLAKGLAAYGQDVLYPPNGAPIHWRQQLIERLLALQKTDPNGGGYWVNEVGRYWESDPVLVTSYAMIALKIALGQ